MPGGSDSERRRPARPHRPSSVQARTEWPGAARRDAATGGAAALRPGRAPLRVPTTKAAVAKPELTESDSDSDSDSDSYLERDSDGPQTKMRCCKRPRATVHPQGGPGPATSEWMMATFFYFFDFFRLSPKT